MPDKTVIYSKKGHVARVTLNRPDAGNAISRQLAQELEEVCTRVNRDDRVYVVTVTGAGAVFCSFGNGEPGELPSCNPAAAIASIDRPVIVAVNGDALGEGLEIALSGDIRLASDNARFGLSQVSRGRIPVDGGTQRLPRIIGRGKALELLMTGDVITAGEALEIGLVSKVVPPAELVAETGKLAETVAAKGPIALRYLKEAVNKGMDMTLEQGLCLEADLYFLLHTTADRTEGIKAFQEKRPPKYKGK